MASQVSSTLQETNVEALLRSANDYLGQGALDQAERAFQQVNMDSEGQYRAEASNGLGAVAMARGRTGHAMSLFRQAIEIETNYTWARQNLIHALIIEGQRQTDEGLLKRAADTLRAARSLALDHDHDAADNANIQVLGRAFSNLGLEYRFRRDKIRRAIDFYREGRSLAPNDTVVRFRLDEALLATGLPGILNDFSNRLTCDDLGTHLVVACFPKSGSTFLKNVLLVVTGFAEQNLAYSHGKNDTGIYLPDMINSAKKDTVTQIHLRASDSNINILQGFSVKPVILVRNIFDVLLSYKEHHDNFAKEMSFYGQYEALAENQRLDLIVDDRAAWYIGFFAGWQRAVGTDRIEGLWLTYEDLMQDKIGHVEKILHFTVSTDRARRSGTLSTRSVETNRRAV